MSVLGNLRENPECIEDNFTVSSVADVVEELESFKAAGGKTIVDATTVGIGRSPKSLRRAADKSHVNIVAGSGYYVGISQPRSVRNWSKERMTQEIVKDLTVGIGDSEVRAGIIGEVGALNDEPNKLEAKSLAAAARSQEETGSGIILHTTPKAALKLLDLLQDNGADLGKVVAAHADALLSRRYATTAMYSPEERLSHYSLVTKSGSYIAFDGFGAEYWNVSNDDVFYSRPRDFERAEQIAELVREGLLRHILISQDHCFKSHMKKYGGFGWEHIPLRIMRLLKWAGLSDADVNTILVENPARFLAF
jgi:phosphotriesterase-related protein